MKATMQPAMPHLMLLLLLPIAIFTVSPAEAFSTFRPAAAGITLVTNRNARCISLRAQGFAASDKTSDDDEASSAPSKKAKKKGDSIRDATGIRPSLHPVTINCVAEALLLRSQCVLGKSKIEDDQEISIDTANTESEPLQIAITAAGIAMAAIDQRSDVAKTDETTDIFTTEESQTISGRVIGVVMRMRELEGLLIEKVNGVTWVRKYGEEESFGVLKSECQIVEEQQGGEENDGESNSNSESAEKQLAETISNNPLYRMNRAECMLALFLSTVEQPTLERVGEDVAGGSKVDFIDADRLEVLI